MRFCKGKISGIISSILFWLLVFCGFSLDGAIKAIAFDMGKVVARYDQRSSFEFVSRSLGLPLDVVATYLPVEFVRDIEQNQMDEACFWTQFVAKHGGVLPPGWVQQWTHFNINNITRNEAVMELICKLQSAGYQTPMLSNVSPYSASIYRQSGLYNYFFPVLLSCEIGARKPDPKAYLILLESVGLPADEVIFVDDKPENIQAARQLGIDGIQFCSISQLREALAERGILISKSS